MKTNYISQKRINYLNEYLKEKFGERTLKICVDGRYHEIKAVVFSRKQSEALLQAADNAQLVAAYRE